MNKFVFTGLADEISVLTKPDFHLRMSIAIETTSNNPPEYATDGSAGFDISASEPALIPAHGAALVKTGLFVAIPRGFELQIRSRSGLALKNNIAVANSPGTIDSDYRGEIGVILRNFGDVPFSVAAGDRIAQGVVAQVFRASWSQVPALSITERGSGGFGSTGR